MKRADRLWVEMMRETKMLEEEGPKPYKSNVDRVNDVYKLNLSVREIAALQLVEQATDNMSRKKSKP